MGVFGMSRKDSRIIIILIICEQSLVSRYVRVIQAKNGARLKRRLARARLGRGPRLGTRIKPPELKINIQSFNKNTNPAEN